ncbi:mediator of RNA polymerase II transcription subunit 33A-like [Dorcoceras hygrometricum]|uniref:Mediator of RNA polymerase II transcription subunit 33A-like n=1 Tax=Dorcoceras hygrometricum TaxID=472368 RepID=A0A2Z7D069_9LAMI|nr:mediator of RNA polymerase II transcription subunit 33A-like [Dorcoceras hygrometricum]
MLRVLMYKGQRLQFTSLRKRQLVFEESEPIVANVIAETAQMGADEEEIDIGGATVSGSAAGSQEVEKADEFELWLNILYEEFHARQDGQPVVTASDTDEDIETIDVGTVDCPLPSAEGEVMKIQLGKSISIPGVHEGDWYKASLPKIPATDKGKALLQERAQLRWVKIPQRIVNNEILRQRSYDDTLPPISKFFQLMNKRWADICIEVAQFYVSGTVDIRNFVSSIAEDRFTLRAVQSVNRSVFVSTHVQSIASPVVEGQRVHILLDQCPFSSSSSDDSSLHFDDTDAAVTSLFLPTTAPDVTDAFAQIRTSIDQIRVEQIRRKDDVAAIRSELFDFRAKAEENHLNLSTQLGFLVDYINRGGDAKKGEGGISRPQPPPEDQSRPSGGSGGTGSRAGD